MRSGLTAILFSLLLACPQGSQDLEDAGAARDASSSACVDCPAPARCLEGQCLPDCSCPEGEVCDVHGHCGRPCSQDAQCPPTWICEDDFCRLGCSDDESCGEGQICERSRCRERDCSVIDDCEGGQVCERQRCVDRGEAPCQSEEDCGLDWRCSSHRLCFAGDCLVHGDCEPDERCRDGRCLGRVEPEHGVLFERVYTAPMTDHLARSPVGGFTGYGLGAALFDIDGDLDLDLFLGRQQVGEEATDESPACIYENKSIPGQLRFEPMADYCDYHLGRITNAFGLDVEGDGFHELLALGTGVVQLWRFHPQPEVIDLMIQVAADDPRRDCEAGSLASMDLNLDGRMDMVVGCQLMEGTLISGNGELVPGRIGNIVHLGPMRNLVYLQDTEGQFVLSDDPALIDSQGDRYGLEDDGSTLCLGQIDVDEDGLLDLVVANDSFSYNGNQLPPGGVYFRCAPAADCTWTWRGLGLDIRIYGSFMGLGNFHVEGLGEHLYVTDQGENLATRFLDRQPIDVAEALDIELSHREGEEVISWGVVVDDFDRDGRDDLYVSNGGLAYPVASTFELHVDKVLLQKEPGNFLHLEPEEIGLAVHDFIDSGGSSWVYASRGAIKSDLDADGFLELLTLPMEGYFRIQAEVPTISEQPPRCTLVPRPRYVPAFGFGYAVANRQGDRWWRRDMQGQMRFGASPFVLSTLSRGQFRFPSGAIVDFDCENNPGPVLVEEPEWIRFLYREGLVKLRLDTPWLGQGLPQIMVLFEGPDGMREATGFHDGIGWDLQPQANETRMMIKLNGKWISRWFATR